MDVASTLDIVLRIVVILAPILWAFYRRDKDALRRLLDAVPAIYLAVQQERRKKGQSAIPDALGRAIEIATVVAGHALSARQRAQVETALKAEHERHIQTANAYGRSFSVVPE